MEQQRLHSKAEHPGGLGVGDRLDLLAVTTDTSDSFTPWMHPV
jgi:hypothetical protein